MSIAVMRKEDIPSFFERLQEVLNVRGWSQSTLAKQASLSTATISRWANGKNPPSSEALEKITKVLGCNAEWLRAGEGNAWQGQKSGESKAMSFKIVNSLRDHISQYKEDIPEEVQEEMFNYLHDQCSITGFSEEKVRNLVKGYLISQKYMK